MEQYTPRLVAVIDFLLCSSPLFVRRAAQTVFVVGLMMDVGFAPPI
jgi:hypothetical protein